MTFAFFQLFPCPFLVFLPDPNPSSSLGKMSYCLRRQSLGMKMRQKVYSIFWQGHRCFCSEFIWLTKSVVAYEDRSITVDLISACDSWIKIVRCSMNIIKDHMDPYSRIKVKVIVFHHRGAHKLCSLKHMYNTNSRKVGPVFKFE